METVREAGVDDLGELERLAGLARHELEAERGGAMWRLLHGRPDPLGATLAADLAEAASGSGLVLLGEVAGSAAGYAVAHLEESGDGIVAVVSDVFVEPEFRDIGLGAALMARLLDWAQANDCRGIDSLVLPGMRSSKNYFERFGLTARAILVHRDLRTRPAEPADDQDG